MNPNLLRQNYRPRRRAVPVWVQRLWAWL